MAVPLGELTLRPRHHLSALWWLGLLYRRPLEVVRTLEGLSCQGALLSGACLLAHALPWTFAIAFLGRMLLMRLAGADGNLIFGSTSGALDFTRGFAIGIAFGTVIATAIGILRRIASWIADGITNGIVFGIAFGIFYGIGFGVDIGVNIASGITGGILFGVSLGIYRRIVKGMAMGAILEIALAIGLGIIVGIIVGIVGGFALGTACGVGFGIGFLRAYYYPAHACFLFPPIQGRWYRFHPVAWDDLCQLPFLGLHRLLAAYGAIDPASGEREIERLINSYPTQRGEALKARAILVATEASAERDLAALDARVAALPDGDRGFLREVRDVRGRIGEIAQLQRRLDTMTRPAFREPVAAQLVTSIENFRHQVAGFREPLASEFRKAAEAWRAVAEAQLENVRTVLAQKPTTQVFRAGDPVDRANEAFVPRVAVIEELESQIMLSTGCPGLLLYGRRRMGKSTLLRNITGFLPESVLMARFSMQNPNAFTSLASFAGLVGRTAREALSDVPPAVAPETLPDLFEALGGIDIRLGENGRKMLLACDEYEAIDAKIGEGVFKLDLLATIRECVQEHRHITWVFAGSHDLSELTNADWSSYFVSLRTIEVLPFEPKETYLLLTEPLKWSPLWREREAERPRFDSSFWGENGINRIQAETGGWPHLVKLVAETAVDLANDKRVRELDAEMLELAFSKAVGRGDAVLRQLVESESRSAGERAFLLGFRDHATQPPPDDADVRAALRRRRLVLDDPEGWRLRAPLMRRWLLDRC